MKLQQLQERKNKGATDIREMSKRYDAEKKAWPTEEDRQAWEKLNADYDATLKELESEQQRESEAAAVTARLQLLDEQERRSVNSGQRLPGLDDTAGQRQVGADGQQVTEETRGLALAGWLLGLRSSAFTDRHAEAMRRCGLRPGVSEFDFTLPGTHQVRSLQREFRSHHPSVAAQRALESRALSSYVQNVGGATVGQTLLQTLEINLLAYGAVRQVAETLVTSTGEEMNWPTVDDTSNEGEQLGESTAGTNADPSFAVQKWNAYKFGSKPILVPYELLQDSFVDLPMVLGQLMGERLGRITNRRYTTGLGATQPYGIVTAAALGVTAASATAVTANEILALIHSVDPAYRNESGVGFMFHDNILLKLRQLQDSQNRPLWQPGYEIGSPDRFAGYGYSINQHMASSMATTQKTFLFGALNRYKVRRVQSVRMYRLEERYRDSDQDGFIAFLREDGNLLNAGTNPVKYLQQA